MFLPLTNQPTFTETYAQGLIAVMILIVYLAHLERESLQGIV